MRKKPPVHNSQPTGRDLSEGMRSTGMNHLFLVGWHDNGIRSSPMTHPVSRWNCRGTRAGIESIHAAGGRVPLYTNARLIDIYGDFYREGGKNAVSPTKPERKSRRLSYRTPVLPYPVPAARKMPNTWPRSRNVSEGEYGATACLGPNQL